MTSSGPLPTTLTFLSLLPTFAIGRRVRFLGCVTSYNVSTGCLELQHTSHAPADTSVSARVDATLLLDHLKREDTMIGAWVNIVGYTQGMIKDGTTKDRPGKESEVDDDISGGKKKRVVKTGVQAIMLWAADSVRLADYERAVAHRLHV